MTDRFAELAEHYDNTDLSAQIEASEPAAPAVTAGASEPMEAFTVRLPVTLLDVLRERAAAEGIATGQMIRRTLEEAVSEIVEDDQVVPVRELRALIAGVVGSPVRRGTKPRARRPLRR